MIILRKLLTLFASFLLVFGFITSTKASTHNEDDEPEKMQMVNSADEDNLDDNNEQEGSGEDMDSIESDDESEIDDETEDSDDENESSNRLENAIRKFKRLRERINNPDVGNQIQNMVEETERFQERSNQALSNFQARPGFLKFLIGPDYKNAGKLRSELVRLQSKVQEMTQLRNALEDEEDIQEVDEVINDLNEEIEIRQSELNEELSGFSLFGWLSKLLSGY